MKRNQIPKHPNNNVFVNAMVCLAVFIVSLFSFVYINPGLVSADTTPTEVVEVDSVYSVATLEQLLWIKNQINSGETFSGTKIILTNDIAIPNEEWTTMANHNFYGYFSGSGHTVSIEIGIKDSNNQTFKSFAQLPSGTIGQIIVEYNYTIATADDFVWFSEAVNASSTREANLEFYFTFNGQSYSKITYEDIAVGSFAFTDGTTAYTADYDLETRKWMVDTTEITMKAMLRSGNAVISDISLEAIEDAFVFDTKFVKNVSEQWTTGTYVDNAWLSDAHVDVMPSNSYSFTYNEQLYKNITDSQFDSGTIVFQYENNDKQLNLLGEDWLVEETESVSFEKRYEFEYNGQAVRDVSLVQWQSKNFSIDINGETKIVKYYFVPPSLNISTLDENGTPVLETSISPYNIQLRLYSLNVDGATYYVLPNLFEEASSSVVINDKMISRPTGTWESMTKIPVTFGEMVSVNYDSENGCWKLGEEIIDVIDDDGKGGDGIVAQDGTTVDVKPFAFKGQQYYVWSELTGVRNGFVFNSDENTKHFARLDAGDWEICRCIDLPSTDIVLNEGVVATYDSENAKWKIGNSVIDVIDDDGYGGARIDTSTVTSIQVCSFVYDEATYYVWSELTNTRMTFAFQHDGQRHNAYIGSMDLWEVYVPVEVNYNDETNEWINTETEDVIDLITSSGMVSIDPGVTSTTARTFTFNGEVYYVWSGLTDDALVREFIYNDYFTNLKFDYFNGVWQVVETVMLSGISQPYANFSGDITDEEIWLIDGNPLDIIGMNEDDSLTENYINFSCEINNTLIDDSSCAIEEFIQMMENSESNPLNFIYAGKDYFMRSAPLIDEWRVIEGEGVEDTTVDLTHYYVLEINEDEFVDLSTDTSNIDSGTTFLHEYLGKEYEFSKEAGWSMTYHVPVEIENSYQVEIEGNTYVGITESQVESGEFEIGSSLFGDSKTALFDENGNWFIVSKGQSILPNSFADMSIRLVNDIDLSEVDEWKPIGTESTPFSGNFNGNYKTVSNAKIRTISTDTGLFGYCSNSNKSTIKNLKLVDFDCFVVGNKASNIGVVAGRANNYGFEQIAIESGNLIFVNDTSSETTIGGLVGVGNTISINDCYSKLEMFYDDPIGESTITIARFVGTTMNTSSIENSFVHKTEVLEEDELEIDGIVTSSTTNVNYCYLITNDSEVEKNIIPLSDISTSKNFVGFNFDNVWYSSSNGPVLQKFTPNIENGKHIIIRQWDLDTNQIYTLESSVINISNNIDGDEDNDYEYAFQLPKNYGVVLECLKNNAITEESLWLHGERSAVSPEIVFSQYADQMFFVPTTTEQCTITFITRTNVARFMFQDVYGNDLTQNEVELYLDFMVDGKTPNSMFVQIPKNKDNVLISANLKPNLFNLIQFISWLGKKSDNSGYVYITNTTTFVFDHAVDYYQYVGVLNIKNREVVQETEVIIPEETIGYEVAVLTEGVWNVGDTQINLVASYGFEYALTDYSGITQAQINSGSFTFTDELENTHTATLTEGVWKVDEDVITVSPSTYSFTYGGVEKTVAVEEVDAGTFKFLKESWNQLTPDAFESGDGSIETPFIISSAAQLLNMKHMVETDAWNYSNKYYQLGADIDLSGKLWEPIGVNGVVFSGSFYGDGHVITGLEIYNDTNSTGENYFGLFATLGSRVEIANLRLSGVKMSVSDLSSTMFVGIIAGKTSYDTIVSNVYIESGDIFAYSTKLYMGGMFGFFSGDISLSYSQANINAQQTGVSDIFVIGGLVGRADYESKIFNAYAIYEPHIVGYSYYKSSVAYIVGSGSSVILENVYYALVEGRSFNYNLGEVEMINGYNNAIVNSYFEAPFSSSLDAQRKTRRDMQSQLTYYQWNFETIWIIDINKIINKGLPYFDLERQAQALTFRCYINGQDNPLPIESTLYPTVSILTGEWIANAEEQTKIYSVPLEVNNNYKYKIIPANTTILKSIYKNGNNVLDSFLFEVEEDGTISFYSTMNTLGEYSVFIEMDTRELTIRSVFENQISNSVGVIKLDAESLGEDGVEGTMMISTDTVIDEEIVLTATANSGYLFAGWYTEQFGGELVSVNAEYHTTTRIEDSEIYAKYVYAESWTYIAGSSPLEAVDLLEEDVLEINNIEDLLWFSSVVNNGTTFVGKTIKLNTNISLEGKNWTPIGTDTNPFIGTFDGTSKCISNLSINQIGDFDSAHYYGLFGVIKNASVIENLYLENVKIIVDDVNHENQHYIGAFVGKMVASAMHNSYATGTIISNANIGGLVGHMAETMSAQTISNCYSRIDITHYTLENGNIGGIVSKVDFGVVEMCYVASQLVVVCDELPEIFVVSAICPDSAIKQSVYFDYEYGRLIVAGISYSAEQVGITVARTKSEMTTRANYVNWNFDNVWAFMTMSPDSLNDGYPVLYAFEYYTIVAGEGLTLVNAADENLYRSGDNIVINANGLDEGEVVAAWKLNGNYIVDQEGYTITDTSISFVVDPSKAGLYESAVNYRKYYVYFRYNYGGLGSYQINEGTVNGVERPYIDPERPGYRFVGWNSSYDGTGTVFSSLAPVVSSTQYYAQWELLKYTLTLDYNYAGSVDRVVPEACSATGITIPLDVSPRNGYQFLEWNTASNGYGETVTRTTSLTSNTTIYAIWHLQTYDVYFDYNYPTGIVVESTGSINGTVLPANPSRISHEFLGWYTESQCINELDETLPVASSFYVYAKWREIEYTIVYYVDGVRYHTDSHWSTTNRILPAVPIKAGFSFFGWRVGSETGSVFNAESIVYTDLNVYAAWQQVSGKVYLSFAITDTQNIGRTNNDYIKVIFSNASETKIWNFWVRSGQTLIIEDLIFDNYNVKLILPAYYTSDDDQFVVQVKAEDSVIRQTVYIECGDGDQTARINLA